MRDRDLNRIKFRCDDAEEITAETLHKYSDSADKVKVDRNGRTIICDPQWIERISSLVMLLDDEAARNRLGILSNKTQRSYGSDYMLSHSVTTASSALNLLLGMSPKAMVSPPEFFAIKELGELVAIANLKRREEEEGSRRGNVTFVDAV